MPLLRKKSAKFAVLIRILILIVMIKENSYTCVWLQQLVQNSNSNVTFDMDLLWSAYAVFSFLLRLLSEFEG